MQNFGFHEISTNCIAKILKILVIFEAFAQNRHLALLLLVVKMVVHVLEHRNHPLE